MEPSRKVDSEVNNCLCLICGCSSANDQSYDYGQPTQRSSNNDNIIGEQLNVIFLLKNVLQVPNSNLHEFLKSYGNPDSWISLCKQCTHLTRLARNLHLQIVEITRKLDDYQKTIVEKVKTSMDTPHDEEDEKERSKVNVNTQNITIWKEIRNFVKEYHFDDLYLEDPILEANQLIKKLQSTNQLTWDPLSSPKIECDLEEEDNFEPFSPNPSSPSPPPPKNQKVPKDFVDVVTYHKCHLCPTKFSKQSPLLRHLQTEHKLDELPCPQPGCQVKSKTIKNFFEHQYRHRYKKHEEELGSVKISCRTRNFKNAKSEKCPKCSLIFPSITTCFKHMSTVHKIENFPCLHPGCQKTFHKLRNYCSHYRLVHLTPWRPPKPRKPRALPKDIDPSKKLLCDICGASFTLKSNLKSHHKFVHQGKQRNYKDTTCHICGMILREGILKRHMLRKHSDAWEGDGDKTLFQCKVVGCKRCFVKKESLDKHIRKTHQGWDGQGDPPKDDKPTFKCETCGMGFYFKGRLEIHELLHEKGKLKQFICDCGKGFQTEKHLDNHKKFKMCKMVGMDSAVSSTKLQSD